MKGEKVKAMNRIDATTPHRIGVKRFRDRGLGAALVSVVLVVLLALPASQR
jgi:hypothetical protein